MQPGNGPSRALIERLGFRRGCVPPLPLKIGSRWREHERWTPLRADWLGVDRQEFAARA